jgi:hypothetical protein
MTIHFEGQVRFSTKGPRNCRSLHGTPGQVGFARDDKKERVADRRGPLPRAKAVVGAVGTSISSPFCAKSKKSQPLGMTKERVMVALRVVAGSRRFSLVWMGQRPTKNCGRHSRPFLTEWLPRWHNHINNAVWRQTESIVVTVRRSRSQSLVCQIPWHCSNSAAPGQRRENWDDSKH